MTTPTITICSVTGTRIDEHALVADRCHKLWPRATKSLLIATQRPRVPVSCEVRQIDTPLGSVAEYGRFCIEHLAEHIDTDYVLMVQWDGFILRPDLWREEWLKYDYIGAPWPVYLRHVPERGVGNSGFSLRSRKWLQHCAVRSSEYNDEGDDIWMCQLQADYMESQGLKIAPVSVAARFSFENPIPGYEAQRPGNTFGFHGRGVLDLLLRRAANLPQALP